VFILLRNVPNPPPIQPVCFVTAVTSCRFSGGGGAWAIFSTWNENALYSSKGWMMLAKNPTVSNTMPLWTPAILAVTWGSRCGRAGRKRACGAGMMRGSRQYDEAVSVWTCSATDDSPMMARRVMTSKRQPGRSWRPQGNLNACE
jgi:hypothetical protein